MITPQASEGLIMTSREKGTKTDNFLFGLDGARAPLPVHLFSRSLFAAFL